MNGAPPFVPQPQYLRDVVSGAQNVPLDTVQRWIHDQLMHQAISSCDHFYLPLPQRNLKLREQILELLRKAGHTVSFTSPVTIQVI